jgi:hypothetical protein
VWLIRRGDGQGFDFQKEKETFLIFTQFDRLCGLPRFLSSGVKRPGDEVDHPHMVLRLGMRGA